MKPGQIATRRRMGTVKPAWVDAPERKRAPVTMREWMAQNHEGKAA